MKKRKFGFSFLGFNLNWSGKRAFGITKLKHKIAKSTGIPTTMQGIERRIGRSILKIFGIK